MRINIFVLLFFKFVYFVEAVGTMVRKKRSEQHGEGETSQQAGGSGGRDGGGQPMPPQQPTGGHQGGGRGWGPQGQGGRGGYGGGRGGPGGGQRGGMSSQQSGGPVEYQGRGAQQQPRGGAPPQRRGGSSGGGGRGGGPISGSYRPSVPELHQASQGSYQPGGQPPQAMTPGKPVEQAEASSAVSPLQAESSEVLQQFEQLSVEEPSSQAIQPLPVSSKSVRFPLRPGKGSTGTKCIVKANHFFAELPDKDLHQYDV